MRAHSNIPTAVLSASVVQLHPRSASTARPVEVIRRELECMSAALAQLSAELADAVSDGTPASVVSPELPDEVLSLQRAAHAIGWAVPRLRRHIVRHNRQFPHDQIGYQPGGRSKTEWSVPMARLRRYVRDWRS